MVGRSIRTITAMSVCTALMVGLQVAMANPLLPNIEVVSLLVILFTLTFRSKVLYIIYGFVLLEGTIYGFQMWWVTYLYIWTILALFAWLFRSADSPLFWAMLSGTFGLLFGALDAIPYIFIGGLEMAFARWVSGIFPFDIVHCAGNFTICLVLWVPLRKALALCAKRLDI